MSLTRRLLGFARYVLPAAFGIGAATVPLGAQTTGGPPGWMQEHMAAMVTGDTLRWITDNRQWQNEDEPFSDYCLRFWWGPGRKSLRGALFAIHEGKETGNMWFYSLYWHPGQQKVILAQIGGNGVYGEGEMQLRPDGVFDTHQDFWTLEGSHSEVRHEERFEGATRQVGLSSTLTDGVWKPGREYTWIKEPSPRPKS